MSNLDLTLIKGVFAPIVTPFHNNEDLDFQSLGKNIEKWSKTRMNGYVVLGSNGEANYMTFEEKVRLVAEVVRLNSGKKVVIAGTGLETTRETIALTKACAREGAQAALILTPFYFKAAMNANALSSHFRAVADASPIPTMLYNMPVNTGLNMDSNLVAELSLHPNIVGIKDSSGNLVQIGEIIHKSKQDFIVFAGSGSYLLSTLVLGGLGTTAALANIMPDELADIYDAFRVGDMIKARKAQLKIMEINKTVTSRYGVPGLKAAMDILGYVGGKPRLPMLPIRDIDKDEIKTIINRTLSSNID